MRQFAYFINSYAKQKINRVIVSVPLENLKDAARLFCEGILLKYPTTNFDIVNYSGLTEMELG